MSQARVSKQRSTSATNELTDFQKGEIVAEGASRNWSSIGYPSSDGI